MSFTVKQIADALGAQVFGASDIMIDRVAEPASAGQNDLALAMGEKYAADLSQGQAKAAMLWDGADWEALGLQAAIIAPRPRFAMSGLSEMMDPGQGFGTGIHPSAVIDPSAKIGENTHIGPLTVIGAGVTIGDNCSIGPQCFIGTDSLIGEGSALREAVTIGARVRIGARFIAQPGVRIGGDGFSFVTPEPSGVEQVRKTLGDQGELKAQSWSRIHSLGGVQIGDDVEIGANTCIDRGSIRDTIIGNGVKFDNLTQIGHNVTIGDDSLICGLVGVAGSTIVGRNVVLGGQTGISDNLTIGDNVITGGGTKVLTSIPAGRVMMGYPAVKMDTHIDGYKSIRRLPRLFRDVAALQKAVFKGKDSD
jgi:UDP-3-O-[3-hydroxymyristoyl] glucosamine N-acyltransferase